MTQQVPEGWYADPQDTTPGAERWWNGFSWTAHTRTRPVPPPPVEPPGPAVSSAPPTPVLAPRSPKQLADGTVVADLGPRLGAYALDLAAVYVTVSVAFTIVDAFTELGETVGLPGMSWVLLGTPVKAVLLAGLWMLYQLAFLTRGQPSLGKRLLGLRVRRLDGDAVLGDRLDVTTAATRAVAGGAGMVMLLFPGSQFFGFALLAFDAYRMQQDPLDRPWHDQLVGTVVVKAPER